MIYKKRSFLLFLTIFFLVEFVACNNVFYYPSKRIYFENKENKFLISESFINGRLHSWFIRPHSKKQSVAKGTIVQFHGNAENLSSHFQSLVWLVNQGYNLLTFDYRGYGKSGGVVSRDHVRQDAIDVIRYLASLPQKQVGKRIVLYGQSIGGTILLESLVALSRSSPKLLKNINAVIIDSSFVSYTSIAWYHAYNNWLFFPINLMVPLGISNRGSVYKDLDLLRGFPVLVIHGDRDEIVPFKMGKYIFNELKTKKTFWLIKGGRHINIFFIEKGKYRKKFLSYLDRI